MNKLRFGWKMLPNSPAPWTQLPGPWGNSFGTRQESVDPRLPTFQVVCGWWMCSCGVGEVFEKKRSRNKFRWWNKGGRRCPKHGHEILMKFMYTQRLKVRVWKGRFCGDIWSWRCFLGWSRGLLLRALFWRSFGKWRNSRIWGWQLSEFIITARYWPLIPIGWSRMGVFW